MPAAGAAGAGGAGREQREAPDEVTGAAGLKLPWERQVPEQMPVLEVKGLNTEWPECFVPAQRTKTRPRQQPAWPRRDAVGLPLATTQETAFKKIKPKN